MHARRAAVRRFDRRQKGAATIEYAVVTALAVLVLVANPSVIVELIQAIREAYASFVYAISLA